MRTPESVTKQLSRYLWADEFRGQTVYAILDGARDTQVFAAVDRSRNSKHCLFSTDPLWWPGHDISWDLIGVAPYLVEMEADSPLTTFVCREGWNNHWGILMRSESRIDRLRTHFREMLMVQTEAGKTLMFRYFDPRILQAYLPTCKSEELLAFFGPVSTFVAPGRDPATAVEYRLQKNRLKKRSIQLDNPASLDGSTMSV